MLALVIRDAQSVTRRTVARLFSVQRCSGGARFTCKLSGTIGLLTIVDLSKLDTPYTEAQIIYL